MSAFCLVLLLVSEQIAMLLNKTKSRHINTCKTESSVISEP